MPDEVVPVVKLLACSNKACFSWACQLENPQYSYRFFTPLARAEVFANVGQEACHVAQEVYIM
jgi:hypothetical protein